LNLKRAVSHCTTNFSTYSSQQPSGENDFINVRRN